MPRSAFLLLPYTFSVSVLTAHETNKRNKGLLPKRLFLPVFQLKGCQST